MPLSNAGAFSDSVCVVQLTDSHIHADAQQRLLGIDTLASLNAVIDLALQECPQIDVVLATGDITQDGAAASYHRFIDAIARMPQACHWIPGNHDDAALMAELGREHDLNRAWVDLGAWRIVLLDSSVPGKVSGALDQSQWARLDEALESAGERHVLVCLHHHPVSIGSDWMEPLGLDNAEQLLRRAAQDPRVKAILWGHIHQDFDRQHGHVRLLATPSTCVQFAPDSPDFATDTQAPGYRWLHLHADGRLETAVKRLAAGRFECVPDASGY